MVEQELRDILGKNIKHFRRQRKISQAVLAEKTGISVTFLSNLERGNNFPKAKTLCGLARELNVDVWEFFKNGLLPDESKIMSERFAQTIKTQINKTLDEIFNSSDSHGRFS